MNIEVLDRYFIVHLRRYGPMILRDALAVVFVWFGALKLFGVSPVSEMVTQAMPWFSSSWFLPVLGGAEVLLGVCLFFGLALRFTLAILAAHLLGTFSMIFTLPQLVFQRGNPLLLTVEGEFVVKNLVLFAAALVIASTLPPLESRRTLGQRLFRRP